MHIQHLPGDAPPGGVPEKFRVLYQGAPARRLPRGGNRSRVAAQAEPRKLALEVRFDAQPIEGRVYEHEGLDRRFSGWLGLMAAIEAARAAGPGQDDKGAA